jgi:hypothetical protein
VQRVTRLKKDQAGVVQEINPSLDNFGMADRNLNSLAHLLCEPSPPPFGGHIGRQHRYADPFPRQNALQPPCDIALPGINGVHVAAAVTHLQFSPYDLNQPPFLGVHELLIQILRLGDQESFPALRFWIVLVPIKISDVPGVIRVRSSQSWH